MPRPITIVTGQWADLDLENLCRRMAELGFDGLELACHGAHLDARRAASDPAYVREVLAILRRHKLGCWAISAHLAGQCVGDRPDERLDLFAPDELKGKPESIRAWAVEEMMLAPRAAANLGVPVVTGFTGSPIWPWWYSFPETSERMVAEGYARIKELWSPILDEFDRCGVRFALEVHPTEIAFDYYSTLRLLETFERRPALGINFDPSHLLWQGVRPELFARDFADRIYNVHIKDVKLGLDGRSGVLGSHLPFGDLRRGWNFVTPGRGDVDFDAIIRELNAAGYAGPLSVEWEDAGMDREYGAREALEYVRKHDFAPSGVAFDAAMKK
jgi:sugar phosphate isomerase/epimerase